jgi:diacylglycerol kinase (ATP)
MKPKRSIDSFRYATDGIVHAVRTQKHLRFHLAVVVAVLLLAHLCRVGRLELIALLFAISLVLVSELMNTALEAAVDLHTESYHPLAKYAKDIAAGAVLVTSLNAVAVGLLVFLRADRLGDLLRGRIYTTTPPDALVLAITTVVLMGILILVWKVMGERGSLFHGGAVSGHAAIGTFLATSVFFLSKGDILVGAMAFVLAFLVGQSRVEGKIHSVREVVAGGLLGLVVTLAMFRVLPDMLIKLVH